VEGGKVVGANVACSCSAVIDPSDGAINFDDLAQHVGSSNVLWYDNARFPN
jgi:hypothetical protein